MILSRTAGENALLNKHELKRLFKSGHLVKGLPLVESIKQDHIEEIAGNQLRVLKDYPAAFDFLVNYINEVWINSPNPHIHFKRVDQNYWKTLIFEPTWREYFSQCGNFTIRQSLARQVMKDLQTGFIKIKGQDKKGRYYTEERAPFRIMARRIYADGTGYREVFLSDAVFGSLITMDCTKKGGDSFVEFQPLLYPMLTGPDTGLLKSYNPVYKLNLLGLMKNTHKKKLVELPRSEFLENTVPEYLDRHGNLDIPVDALRRSLENNMSAALQKIPQGLLVKNYYLGSPGGTTTIYFRHD